MPGPWSGMVLVNFHLYRLTPSRRDMEKIHRDDFIADNKARWEKSDKQGRDNNIDLNLKATHARNDLNGKW